MGVWIKDKVFENADSFLDWLDQNFGEYINKHINEQHTHHTWSPNHSSYSKYNTLQLHKNMRNYHVNTNGWDDIAQHITIGKDGDIVTGRDIQQLPVSAKGYNGNNNLHPFSYEMIGNFDIGNDRLEGKQLESAIKISRYFYNKGKEIKFHRELLINGKQPKSCPGTGIDKGWFMGLVTSNNSASEQPTPQPIQEAPKPQPAPSNPTYPTINEGDKGEWVNKLQQKLVSLGYKLPKYGCDSDFGAETKAAVIEFQGDNGLDKDGIVGKLTWGKLETVSPKPVSQPVSQPVQQSQPKPTYPNKLYRVEKPMLHDHNVELIQEALNRFFGRNVVKVDSWFGNETAAWVGEFQHRKGLTVDKIVGQHTWGALF